MKNERYTCRFHISYIKNLPLKFDFILLIDYSLFIHNKQKEINMNDLKERIEKTLVKNDIVILSGVFDFNKTDFINDLVKNYEESVYLTNVIEISYKEIKNTIKDNSFIVIDDVRSEDLQPIINKIHEAIVKTNKKAKVIIATTPYKKDSVKSVLLKIKHFKFSRPKPSRAAEVKQLNKLVEEQKALNDKIQISCMKDLFEADQEIERLRKINKEYEWEVIKLDNDKIALRVKSENSINELEEMRKALDRSVSYNEEIIKENHSLHSKIKEINSILYDAHEESIQYQEKINDLETANQRLDERNDSLIEYVSELQETLNNECDDARYHINKADELTIENRWLKNKIAVYTGEVDAKTIRAVNSTVKQLRESFGDDHEV